MSSLKIISILFSFCACFYTANAHGFLGDPPNRLLLPNVEPTLEQGTWAFGYSYPNRPWMWIDVAQQQSQPSSTIDYRNFFLGNRIFFVKSI